MHKETDNPFAPFRDISLNDSEKRVLRAQVQAFIATYRPRHWYGWFVRHALATLVLVFVIGGSGLFWVADSAAPDSMLYGVRTSVNDQVRITAAGDELAQIERELELMERYFEEEEALVTQELTL